MEKNKNYANLKGFSPEGKVCVITGGSSGIGKSLIEELIFRKAKLLINIDLKKSDDPRVESFCANVGSFSEIKKVILEIYKRFGNIDLFCCNAGVACDDAADATVHHWKKIIDTNLMQHIYAVNCCIENMLKNKSGWFLVTASAAGLLSQVGSATYSTTKHATVGFAEWLSITYGNKGIGVSLLCPQGVKTAMTANIKDGGVAGINGMLEAEEVAKKTLDDMEKGKFLITPHEIVKKYIKIKSNDTDSWILGMRKLYQKYINN